MDFIKRAMTRPRCPVCDWPMAESQEGGCVPGNCSQENRRQAYIANKKTDPYRDPPLEEYVASAGYEVGDPDAIKR